VDGIAHQLGTYAFFKGTTSRQFGRLFSALGVIPMHLAMTKLLTSAPSRQDKLKALLVLEADRMQNA